MNSPTPLRAPTSSASASRPLGPGLPAPESHDRYYDTSTAEPEDKHVIDDALEYLELRGQLERHPEKPHLVRFRSIH